MDWSFIGGGSRGRVLSKQQTVPLLWCEWVRKRNYSDLCTERHCKPTLDLE